MGSCSMKSLIKQFVSVLILTVAYLSMETLASPVGMHRRSVEDSLCGFGPASSTDTFLPLDEELEYTMAAARSVIDSCGNAKRAYIDVGLLLPRQASKLDNKDINLPGLPAPIDVPTESTFNAISNTLRQYSLNLTLLHKYISLHRQQDYIKFTDMNEYMKNVSDEITSLLCYIQSSTSKLRSLMSGAEKSLDDEHLQIDFGYFVEQLEVLEGLDLTHLDIKTLSKKGYGALKVAEDSTQRFVEVLEVKMVEIRYTEHDNAAIMDYIAEHVEDQLTKDYEALEKIEVFIRYSKKQQKKFAGSLLKEEFKSIVTELLDLQCNLKRVLRSQGVIVESSNVNKSIIPGFMKNLKTTKHRAQRDFLVIKQAKNFVVAVLEKYEAAVQNLR